MSGAPYSLSQYYLALPEGRAKEIQGVRYLLEDGLWRPIECGDPAPFICQCGGKAFEIFASSRDDHSARCLSCGHTAVLWTEMYPG